MASRKPVAPSETTRHALILAALRLFGRNGYEGTSTRQIAAEATANIGSIAYHFGGKEGLRMAVADHIVDAIRSVAGPALDTGTGDDAVAAGLEPRTAARELTAAVERMVGFLVASQEAGDIAQFMLRELGQPSPALDRIYCGVIEPTHRRLCRVWEAATGEPAESDSTKITVFTLIGQVIYFRIGREAVVRRLGWSAIGPEEASEVSAAIRSNVEAILAARRGGPA